MSRKTIGVIVHLLATNEGGRSGPLLTGYRSLLRFEGTEVDFGFELELDPEAKANGLAPGDSGNARLSFWAVEELPTLSAGQTFEIREGTRIVGYGSVVKT
jgi:translation elongation factor EF-Tu-like GTPase